MDLKLTLKAIIEFLVKEGCATKEIHEKNVVEKDMEYKTKTQKYKHKNILITRVPLILYLKVRAAPMWFHIYLDINYIWDR